MADTNEIVFSYKLIGSSDLPGKIHLDKVLETEYTPWNSLHYTSDTVRTTGAEGQVSRIDIVYRDAASPVPGNVTFSDVWRLGYASYGDLIQLAPNTNDKVNIYTIELGHDDLNNYCEIRCDVTNTYSYSSNMKQFTCTIYLYLGNRGSSSYLTRQLFSRAYQMSDYGSSSAYIDVLHFALPILHLPGRDDDIDQSVMEIMCAYETMHVSGTSIPNYSFTAGGYTGSSTQYYTSQYVSQALYYVSCATALDLQKLLDELGMEISVEYVSEEAGEPSEPGGYTPGTPGKFDDTSDSVGVPTLPTIGVSNVGFVNVYKVSSGGLVSLGQELFPALQYSQPASISGTDVVDTLVNGFNAIMTFLANVPSFFDQTNAATFINYIIDCHILPVTPSGGSSEYIKVGSKTLTCSGTKLSSDYVEIDCGEIELGEYYANFADYLTNFKLYLPFVGMVSSRPEWFYRESLKVVYHFNIVDGSFMAYVLSTGAYVNNNNSGRTIVGQYGGNCCVHIPITGVTYSSMVSGLVGSGSGAVAAAGSGNIPALTTSAISAAAAHGDIAQSNTYASSVSFLGCRRPFAIIERPVSSFSTKYAVENGIPSNVARKLGDVTGFSMIGDIHLDGVNATEEEKTEIERLLHDGVIL